MLDGTTDKQDARLLADINAAPDPFDGGCPADVCDDPAHGGRGVTMGDAAAAVVKVTDGFIDRAHQLGRERGVVQASIWLRANGFGDAASALMRGLDSVLVD